MRRWPAGNRAKPCARWLPRQGWDVQRLKIDDGCYEVYGKDAQGRSFKAKVDPETLRVVKMKRRDKDRDGERSRDRDRRAAFATPRTFPNSRV